MSDVEQLKVSLKEMYHYLRTGEASDANKDWITPCQAGECIRQIESEIENCIGNSDRYH